jgi:hypothetical protein
LSVVHQVELDDAPSLETAQWLAEDVGMETEPIAIPFNLPPEP